MKTVADSVNKTRKTFGLDAKKRIQEGILILVVFIYSRNRLILNSN